jgi:two-component system NtrC family response regulator
MALEMLASWEPELLITDVRMPGVSGLTLVKEAHKLYPEMQAIIMTAHGAVEDAVEAMKSGAWDYILKPFENHRLLLTVERCLKISNLAAENRRLREEKQGKGSLVGNSPAMKQVYQLIDKVAATRATVLITGESGTGKELAAHAIHQGSPRQQNPFVPVHCMALSESLLESELFGHEKGAFTGASARRKGRFEMANGGTIFLDEIGEISTSIQVKLLRVLQERSFERVGGSESLQVDVRVVAATNRDLAQAVAKGEFREDLYYRLNVIHIKIPPLREHKEDLPVLAEHFAHKYSQEMGRSQPRLSPAFLRCIEEYSWPGNVRELENALERALIMADKEDVLQIRHLPAEIVQGNRLAQSEEIENLEEAVKKLEKQMIIKALLKSNGVAAHAAEILGITKAGMAYKMKKHNIN